MAAPIIGALSDLFSEQVTLEPYVSQDSFGLETYASGTARACHIEGRSRLIRDSTGQERVSSVQVYLAGAFGTSEKDRITLPGRFSPQQPPIMSVERMSDENGAALGHHEVIFC